MDWCDLVLVGLEVVGELGLVFFGCGGGYCGDVDG